MGGAVLLLALSITLIGAVPATAASCVAGPGANLKSCNLSKADLYGVNLTGANLTNANLTGANLTNANLTGANLTDATGTGVDLQGALISNGTLTGAGMKNALLDGASLQGSTLAGANFSGSDLTGVASGADTGSATLPSKWSLVGGYLIGPAANLTNGNLANTGLAGADLAGANLTGADIDRAVLTNADLSGVISGDLIGIPRHLPADWSVVSGYLVGPGAFLYGANLGGADLSGADAAAANLEGAILAGADLTGANLSNVDAISANLSGTKLAGTNLSRANLAGVTSGSISGTPSALPTATPTSWQLVGGYLVGPYSDLAGAHLSGAHLTGANLTGANLTGADLSESDLTGSYITFTNLEGTDLADAVLTGITSLDIAGTPDALPPGWELVDGVLKITSIPLSRPKIRRISSAGAAPRPPASFPGVTVPQHGIAIYATDSCQSADAWQQEATNEMRGIKSLGANSVSIAFPFYVTGPATNSVFAADLCGEPVAVPVALQSPSPARLAVLVHAAESVGLQVMLRPLMDESNLDVFDNWRGGIKPTNPAAWFASYESVLKPYLEMAQANKVALFAISSELTSLATSGEWRSAIEQALKLYSGQVVFDSSWNVDPSPGDVHKGTAVAQDAYPLLRKLTTTSTVAQILAAWNNYLLVKPLPAAAGRVTFDEVGIAAVDGDYAAPYDSPIGAVFNQSIQANWFAAACEFAKAHKLEGLYFWGPNLPYHQGSLMTQPDPTQPTELQPAAQSVIRSCFK